jgi:hypothetical protein
MRTFNRRLQHIHRAGIVLSDLSLELKRATQEVARFLVGII